VAERSKGSQGMKQAVVRQKKKKKERKQRIIVLPVERINYRTYSQKG
jgi:hypothetical protein